MKRILTLDDLVQFCQNGKLQSFNAEAYGYSLCVQTPAVFKQVEEDDSNSSLMYADVVVMHTGRNRNNSDLTVSAAENAIKDFAYKPVLANFYTDRETGEKDFTSHDFEVDGDGNIVYKERQVGCFTADEPYMEDDPENEGRKYVYAKCAIPKVYTDTVDIIRRKNGTKCSVELIVKSMSYDIHEKCLLLTEVELAGLTLLGKDPETGMPVQEGMEGARVDLIDFSVDRNSVIFDKTIEVMRGLKESLDVCMTAYAESMKGGEKDMEMEKDEVIEKVIPDGSGAENAVVSESAVVDEVAVECSEVERDGVADNVATLSITVNGETKTFSASLVEKLNALTELVNSTYSESDNDFFYVDADEDSKEVYAHGCFSGRHFKQKYSVKKNVYSLQGDRISVFARYLTEDEIESLDKLKANYAAVSERLQKYEEEPKKMGILNSEEYASVAGSDEFVALKAQDAHFDLTVDEVRGRADAILLNAAKNGTVNFAARKEVGFKPIPNNERKRVGRYGGMFAK